MEKKIFETMLSGRKLVVEQGQLAKQAESSVLVRFGNTVVLTVITVSEKASELDFFPLTVIFQEKLYSVGKIPGGFLKREGKASEYGTLSSRVIDRAIRPLFPEGFRNEVQIVNNVLAVDNDNDVRVAALIASSIALSISSIPFNGPVASCLITLDEKNDIIVNPNVLQMENEQMELIVAGTYSAINMVEAGCKEISEEKMLDCILKAHQVIKEIIVFQNEIIKAIGNEKRPVELFNVRSEILQFVEQNYQTKLVEACKIKNKITRYSTIDEINQTALNYYETKEYSDEKTKKRILLELKEALRDVVKNEVRRQIIVEKKRIDERKIDEIRPLASEIDLLPMVHGSALFTRGETQVLSVVTLGAMGEHQIIDGVTDEEMKRFMHHYNFPPFSVGEVGRMGPPSRREIGHGALGEKALLQILPTVQKFPYTIRVVSEVLESNGSSSQASICASCLALMAAGVPIESPVAGIAMGLVKEKDDYTILTDIQGMEDHLGDMDFKVAGTAKGICALQMDIKIDGIDEIILSHALFQAKTGRMKILDNMLSVIDRPRDYLAETAPKMKQFKIPVDKIREVIGSGGKVITNIIEKSNNVKIDIEDDGSVVIYHKNYQDIETAWNLIKDIVTPVDINEIYVGKVVRIVDNLGAFINLKEGIDGLIHVSKLSDKRVNKIEEHLTLGQTVKVKVDEIDQKNKIKLSWIKTENKQSN